jgi:hypothetical protein
VPRFTPQLEVANFHLTFGTAPLIDYFKRIVLPAFLAPHRELANAESGKKKRWLRDTTLIELTMRGGVKTFAIAGRFVRHRLYRALQVEVEDDLVEDPSTLKSDPSSIFVLLLDSHRLLYVKEFATSRATPLRNSISATRITKAAAPISSGTAMTS